MTRAISNPSVAELARLFVDHAEFQREASKADKDVPAFNRHVLKMSAAAKALEITPEGRRALEVLISDSRPFVRVRAAGAVLRWAPHRAIPVLGGLLVEELSEMSPGERLELRISAADSLFIHFNIMTFDHNELIAPLETYGVNLPWRDHSAWQ
jgi:hypothetical protein